MVALPANQHRKTRPLITSTFELATRIGHTRHMLVTAGSYTLADQVDHDCGKLSGS
jgi:hypothetical protein